MSSSSVPGTNVPPISFPGIVSGLNYDSIIQKLTSLTLEQNVGLNAQIATLNAANAELIKINNLISSVQNTLDALSNPSIFDSYSATSSSLGSATATIPTGTANAASTSTPIAGTYTILNSTEATSTVVTNASTAGQSITLGANATTLPLADSDAAITPSNGSGSSGGEVTVDGVQVSYNVDSQSLDTILSNIQSAVRAAGDSSFTATLNANGTVTFSSTQQPITLGSASDSGNLLQVLKLTDAQVVEGGGGGSVTGTSDVGGINQAASFNSSTNAGYATPVTSGFFTINGVKITVSASGDNTASVIARINASNAGVIATYNSDTNQITLTATSTGPQSIVVGASDDTSNFLTAAGLTTASGATTTVGKQATVEVEGPTGQISTVYSNSNTVTNAIQGVNLNITNFSEPYTVTVASNTQPLVSAINSFVSAYNAAISEINSATQPPAVITPTPGSSTTATSSSSGGGVLWQNSNIGDVKNELTSLLTGFFSSDENYNSLASIGLSVSDSFTTIADSSTSGQNSTAASQPSAQTMEGTDGTLQPLNVSTLETALQNDPSAVEDIFQGSSGLVNTLGNYLGQVTGLPTLVNSGVIGELPDGGTGIIAGFESTITDQITNVQTQIQQVTNNANMQANTLRQEFVSTESTLAEYQSMQTELSSFFKSSGT